MAPYCPGIRGTENIARATCSAPLALTAPAPVGFSYRPLLFRFICSAYNSEVQGRAAVCLSPFISQEALGNSVFIGNLLCVRKGIELIDDDFIMGDFI